MDDTNIKNTNNAAHGNTPLTIARPRIDKLLDAATQGKLVYVIAGAGYGKTQAVRSYIEQQSDAVVRWMQLTESDNVGSRYWENLTHTVAFDNPDLADRLREFGFPNSFSQFRKFAEILKETEHRSRKTFLVLDDFHLINSTQALTFAERCAHLDIPGACVIILSRTEPDINTVALLVKGQVSIITEEELRFTGDEIALLYKARGISIDPVKIPQVIDATQGWALAILLLSLVLAKRPGEINTALDTMRQNIFKLMETEAWESFPKDTRKTLVRLSLISDLPMRMFSERFGSSELLKDAPQLASFMWFDSFTGQDRVHPLYWEFLQTKQDILSDKDKQETYRAASDWCRENNLYMDAVKYMAASRQFGRMLEILLTYPIKLPQDMCEYFLDIIENLHPSPEEENDTNYLLLTGLFIPLLLLGAGKFSNAREKCFAAIAQLENSKTPVSMLLLSIAYSNLTYIDMYSCTVTHEYDAPEHLRKSIEYQKLSAVPPIEITGAFVVADVRSFACLVGEGAELREFDDFLDMAKETSRYIVLTSHSMYYGYADLAACEIAFYKYKLSEAKIHAHEAILKAREKNQFSIEAMAAMYLFRIAVMEGDYPVVKELFRQRNDSPGTPYFWNRQFLYELGVSFIYAQIGLPNTTPAWMISDDKDMPHETTVPVRELVCTARLYIVTKQYDRALTLLCAAYPRPPHERFVFGELTLTLLTAAARIRIGDVDGAVRDFEKAYELSYGGVFEMPFIELGKDLPPLIEAVSSSAGGAVSAAPIPPEWLKMIARKAVVYVKKSTVVFDSFKKEQHIEDTVRLSRRERDVLTDLYHGLSREEIATSRYLSINTVHKIIQSVFLKLDAVNKADAIRIAMDKHILE